MNEKIIFICCLNAHLYVSGVALCIVIIINCENSRTLLQMLAMENTTNSNSATNDNNSNTEVNSGTHLKKNRRERRAQNASARNQQLLNTNTTISNAYPATIASVNHQSSVDASHSPSVLNGNEQHQTSSSSSSSQPVQSHPLSVTHTSHASIQSASGAVPVDQETATTPTTNVIISQPLQTPHPVPPPVVSYSDIICTHLHQYGFLQGMFSDLTIFVRVAGTPPNAPAGNNSGDHNSMVSFKLHKILAIRSQMLMHLIQQAELNSPGCVLVAWTMTHQVHQLIVHATIERIHQRLHCQ